MSYENRSFWESVHKNSEESSLSKGEGIREIGGEDSPAGAAHLYKLRQLALERVLSRISLPQNPAIFELGSGGGFWAEHFLNRGGCKFCGSDISPTAVERLSRKLPNASFHSLAAEGAWERIASAGPFDLGLAIDVLYHITDDAVWSDSLSRLMQNVRPGGYALFSDYFFEEPREHPSSHHVKHRHMQTYLDVLDLEKFDIVDIQPVFFLLNRIKSGPFRDGNRISATIIRKLANSSIGLPFLAGFDMAVTKFLRPMDSRSKNRMILARRRQ